MYIVEIMEYYTTTIPFIGIIETLPDSPFIPLLVKGGFSLVLVSFSRTSLKILVPEVVNLGD